MEYTNAYRQKQMILDVRHQLADVEKEIRYTDLAYKIAFAGTFILYFIFVWMMYVSDLWGFMSWLERNASESSALLIYGTMAVLLPFFMSMVKHIGYKHFAKYQNPKYLVISVVAILALAGVIYESISSSSQQQHISRNAAENSKTFAAINSITPTITTGNMGLQIAEAEKKLAQCEQKLAAGKEKHCEGDKAKLKALIDSEQRALSAAHDANIGAITAKAKAIKDLKEDAYKPVFKSIRDTLRVEIDSAVMLVTMFIAIIFEVSHLLLILFLSQQIARRDQLKHTLIELEANYLESTGKTFNDADFRDESILDMDTIREQQKPRPAPAFGFNQPSIVPSNVGFSITSAVADPVTQSGVARQPAAKPATMKKSPMGFIDPNKPAKNTRETVLGSAEVQLEIPELSTYNRELAKHQIDSPDDPAMNQVANKADIERIINKAQHAAQNRPTPHPDAHPEGLAEHPDTHPQDAPSAQEMLSDPANFSLLKSYVEHEKFGPIFIAVATGSIPCSQNKIKSFGVGGDMPKWVLVIMEGFGIVTEPKANKQRELITQLSATEAEQELQDVREIILNKGD